MAMAQGLTTGEKYDIFLSFRGPDTRKSFADCLFEFLNAEGLRVFMDDEELRVGECIGMVIQKAIYDSKFFIPIFSKGYASSKWCLKEITWMADCMEEFPGKKEMLPIFYDVDASDVKLKTDLYSNALLDHEKTSNHETVEKWRKALIKVAQVKGWNRTDAKGEGKLISGITQDISHRLELKHRILPDHFIGIDDKVQHIIKRLDCGSRDVRILVIHGMGGIGKTTLASAVFNKICSQFQGCSFLSDVRVKGIINRQNKLLGDLLRFSSPNFCDVNDAMNRIQVLLQNKEVLVVLDDVSHMDQIRKLIGMGKWVGLGSRVIITTRNSSCIGNVEEIEKNVTILQGKKIFIYQMRELGFDNSLQLLCQHAFGQYVPPHGYEQHSRDILTFTKGIPLAIEVIGSYLKGKHMTIWKEMLKKLKMVPPEHLYREILMSSYEALCDEDKEIFLDIAFFFSGHDKTNAFYYWDACDLFPETSIDTLTSYALVKIDSNNRLWMHDLLRDLGREVIRKESNGNLGRCSRLCNKDAKRLLLKGEGTEYVRALKLDSTHAHSFTPVQLSGLSDLQFLELCGGNFIGQFGDNCLSELRWLSWQDCPLDFRGTNLNLENLVVVKLSESKITDTWAGWEQLKTAISLKVLELEGLNLIATPDLVSFTSLERLAVRDCKSLVQVHPSIGNLECLDSLEVINSSTCRFFPEISHMVLHMPSSICNLKALSRLEIGGFKLKQLPENIGELKGLKVMWIEGCGSLQNLPDSIGDLEFLCELHLRSAGITELPESIGKLGNLIELDVSHNHLRGLPATIGALDRLGLLNAAVNRDLQGEIPSEFGRLKSLEHLNLSQTGICGLPSTIHQLSRLKSLALHHCDKIRQLPDLPTGLRRLWISSQSLKAAPNLLSLTNLVSLDLLYDGSQEALTGSVTDYLSGLTLSCRKPSVMSLLPSGVEPCALGDSKSMSSWERLSNLEGLSRLILSEANATAMRRNCDGSLKNLTSLDIIQCDVLERIHGIASLKKLDTLVLSECPKLVEIEGLPQLLDSLKCLVIVSCNSLHCLPDRSGTESTSDLHLVVRNCSKLRDFDGPYDSYSPREERRGRKRMKLNE